MKNEKNKMQNGRPDIYPQAAISLQRIDPELEKSVSINAKNIAIAMQLDLEVR